MDRRDACPISPPIGPLAGQAERLIRALSLHHTWLVRVCETHDSACAT